MIFVGVVSTGKSAGLGQVLLSSVNRWFVRKRALAMSMCVIGFSSGGAVLSPLITVGVHAIGWRDVMPYSGIFGRPPGFRDTALSGAHGAITRRHDSPDPGRNDQSSGSSRPPRPTTLRTLL